MASIAVRRHSDKFVLLLIDMTFIARGCHVRTEERELCAVVTLRHIGHQPGRRRVAAIACGTEFSAVHVHMTIEALCWRAAKLEIAVALPAIQPSMEPFESESRPFMVELHRRDKLFPGGRLVTILAGDLQITMW